MSELKSKCNVNKGNTVNSKLAKHRWDNNHRLKIKKEFRRNHIKELIEDSVSQSNVLVELRPLCLSYLKFHFQNKNHFKSR